MALALSDVMEGIRILLLATTIGAMMAGTLYAGVQAERTRPRTAQSDSPTLVPLTPVSEQPMPLHAALEPAAEVENVEQLPELALGVAVPDLEELDRLDELDLIDAVAAGVGLEDIVLQSGVRIGALKLADETTAHASESVRRVPQRARRRVPRPPPGPRLHPNPGQHSVLTARQMIARNELIQGSCYAYLSAVYERAGHRSWRKRTIVYRAEREGPYADLSLIRPGDWLYIVNDPGRTPVGTHSVMFVGWEDQARGYARTISHAGWGPPRSGRESGYDVSQTYRIIRPTM